MIAVFVALVALGIRLVVLPFKLALAGLAALAALALLPLRVARTTVRLVGFKATTFFLLGVAAGLAVAPGPGRELRRRVLALAAAAGGVDDATLAERVVFELGHAPRTWHLPQPVVEVRDGTVHLSGRVPHAEGIDELERVAAGVPGVVAVDVVHLVVDGALGDLLDPLDGELSDDAREVLAAYDEAATVELPHALVDEDDEHVDEPGTDDLLDLIDAPEGPEPAGD